VIPLCGLTDFQLAREAGARKRLDEAAAATLMV
jgi:hypothetical protein